MSKKSVLRKAFLIDPFTKSFQDLSLMVDGNDGGYKALRRAIFDEENPSGYIEHVSLQDSGGLALYIDEEGLLKDWSKQAFWKFPGTSIIAGRAVLVAEAVDYRQAGLSTCPTQSCRLSSARSNGSSRAMSMSRRPHSRPTTQMAPRRRPCRCRMPTRTGTGRTTISLDQNQTSKENQMSKFSFNDVIALEQGDASRTESLQALQRAINGGEAWVLQGSYGRAAMDAIESGFAMLGEVGRRDVYGNIIPSRHDVKEGTKGSRQYVVDRQGEDVAKILEAA